MGAAQRSRRWLVPVTAVAVVAGVGALGPVVADASPNLPGITAQDLLAKVQTAKVDGLSGTVRSDADLGLPAIPGAPAGSEPAHRDAERSAHRAGRLRRARTRHGSRCSTTMAERVWTTDGKSAWAYDSSRREAVKLTVPEHKTTKPEKADSVVRPAGGRQAVPRRDRPDHQGRGQRHREGRRPGRVQAAPGAEDRQDDRRFRDAGDRLQDLGPAGRDGDAADRQRPRGRGRASARCRSTYRPRARSPSPRRRV